MGASQTAKLPMGPLHPHSTGRSPKVCHLGADPRRPGGSLGALPRTYATCSQSSRSSPDS